MIKLLPRDLQVSYTESPQKHRSLIPTHQSIDFQYVGDKQKRNLDPLIKRDILLSGFLALSINGCLT